MAQLGIGGGERLREVGERVDDLARGVDVDCALPAFIEVKLGECGVGCVALGLDLGDALADQRWIDAGLDGGELPFEALSEVGALVFEAPSLRGLGAVELAGEGVVLGVERGEALGAEDARCEEAIDDGEKLVLAHVLPLAVSEGLCGFVAVGKPVAAGVVGVVLAGLALHPQGVVAGGALDDPAQLIEAPLGAPPLLRSPRASLLHLGLDPLEPVVGDQCLVPLGGLDPLVGTAADEWSLALLGGSEVEAVPVKAAGVDGVDEHRPQRALRPLAGGVALGVDVAGGRWASGPVEVVGDLVVAPSGEVALEDLAHYWRLLRVGYQARLGVAVASANGVGVRQAMEAVAVGRAAAVAVALEGVLGLAATDLAAELLDVELVERLEEVADQSSLGAGLVARGKGVEDVDAGLR